MSISGGTLSVNGNLSAGANGAQTEILRRAGEAVLRGENHFREVLDALPAAVYVTDATGLITYYNPAAAKLWGHEPALGESHWCGSWKLFWPDGTPLPHDCCPMAMALKEQSSRAGVEAAAERPDGTRVPFLAYPTLLYGPSGMPVGAVNMLVDISDRKQAEENAYRLAAIVASSDDAIVSKDLNGTITSWNAGAERLFGYSAEEVIGKPITILIPPERLHEEPEILARVRRGEAIEHYETVRRRKDGSLVQISLTVSPVKSAEGRIIGVSKIARDITERQRAEARQNLLIREMAHRVKNLFAVAGGLVALSARTAKDPAELAAAVRARLAALSRAHSLTLPAIGQDVTAAQQSTTLHVLVREILHPYDDRADERSPRLVIEGADAVLASSVVTSLALILHELATNAVKYGSLSVPGGLVRITCSEEGHQMVLVWKERGGPPVQAPGTEGFGTRLGRATIEGQLHGAMEWEWDPQGLMIRLRLPTDVLAS